MKVPELKSSMRLIMGSLAILLIATLAVQQAIRWTRMSEIQAIDDQLRLKLDSFADQIKTAVISGVALIFVIAVVTSILVTRRTVGRIESINATSRAIMLSGLDKRIPLRGTNDEWDSVAENLNLMLDRIETLMGEVKQVSDNVAHDLRTPLT